MQAVQKLAVDTTIFHAQAREMKVLPEYGLPAWMEACVEDGPGDAEHYHPPSPALMWNRETALSVRPALPLVDWLEHY